MVKKKYAVCFITVGIMVLVSSLVNAQSIGGKFYFGVEGGVASLNSDKYIYSSDGNMRQPELNVRESSSWQGPAYSVYAGYNIINKEIDIFNDKTHII